MTEGPENPPRKRGRPRMAEEDKKRHNMTFRIRSDLRAAVEELALMNGRSMSEQVERYVEEGAKTEIRLIDKHSSTPPSLTLRKCITGFDGKNDISNHEMRSQDNWRNIHGKELLSIDQKNIHSKDEILSKDDGKISVDLTDIFHIDSRESANIFANTVMKATRSATIEALRDILGPAAKELPALSDVAGFTSVRAVLTELAPLNRPLEEEIESMRADLACMGDAVSAQAVQDQAIRFVLKKVYGIDWVPDGANRLLQHDGPPKNIDDEIASLMGRSVLRNLDRAKDRG